MSSKLTRDEVRHIAELARLELTDAEVELFTRQLADILTYASEVSAIDTTGVAPTSHVATAPRWREDVPGPSLDRATILKNAPDAAPAAGLFRVPKVL
jgi:aspartyl-tRNA(Asn)/glutamyl-tRNA(Gln) amidotransferase subunit C